MSDAASQSERPSSSDKVFYFCPLSHLPPSSLTSLYIVLSPHPPSLSLFPLLSRGRGNGCLPCLNQPRHDDISSQLCNHSNTSQPRNAALLPLAVNLPCINPSLPLTLRPFLNALSVSFPHLTHLSSTPGPPPPTHLWESGCEMALTMASTAVSKSSGSGRALKQSCTRPSLSLRGTSSSTHDDRQRSTRALTAPGLSVLRSSCCSKGHTDPHSRPRAPRT